MRVESQQDLLSGNDSMRINYTEEELRLAKTRQREKSELHSIKEDTALELLRNMLIYHREAAKRPDLHMFPAIMIAAHTILQFIEEHQDIFCDPVAPNYSNGSGDPPDER